MDKNSSKNLSAKDKRLQITNRHTFTKAKGIN